MKYLALNSHERDIPSKSSIQAIWKDLIDEESREIFLRYSNNLILQQQKIVRPDIYLWDSNKTEEEKEVLRLFLYLNQIYEKQAILSGFLNFDLLMQYQVIIKWHESVRANFTGGDGSKFRRVARYCRQVMEGIKSYEPNEEPLKTDYPHLLEYRESEKDLEYSLVHEYKIALSYERLFAESTAIISRTNTEMRELLTESIRIREELTKTPDSKTDTEYLYLCPFCKKCKLVKQGKTPRHCGLCETDYQKNQKKINRPPITPNGWVIADEGKRRNCVNCGEKRQVNINVTCRKCFPQSFTQ
jgi:hypothetical protein